MSGSRIILESFGVIMSDKKYSLPIILVTVLVYTLLPAVAVWSVSTIMDRPFDLTIQSYLAGLVLVIILF